MIFWSCMYKRLFHYVMVACFAGLILFSPVNLLAHDGTHHVLLLNSYHQGYYYTNAAVSGIMREFFQSDLATEVFIEYLDVKRHRPEDVLPRAAALLNQKFPSDFFDVIIVADEPALELALRRRSQLDEQTPIVFFGLQPNRQKLPAGVTGVYEMLSYADTLELALKLHPGTRQVIATGNTVLDSSKRYNEEFIAQTQHLRDKIDIEFWFDLTLEQVLERVKKLPEDRVIMTASVLLQREAGYERLTSHYELSKAVSQVSNIPIYLDFRLPLGGGAVGGRVVDYPRQGVEAARMALQILASHAVLDIPAPLELPNQYVFDYEQLKRHAIAFSQLPKPRVVINQPNTSYAIEKHYLWLGGAALLGLTVLSLSLLQANYSRRRVEKSLRKSEQKFRSVFETTAVGMVLMSLDWKVVQVNQAMCRIAGGVEKDLLLRDIVDFYVTEDSEEECRLKDEIEQGRRQFFHSEKRYRDQVGNTVWGLNTVAAVNGEDGLPLYFVGLVQDITEQKKSENELQLSEAKYRQLTHEFETLLDGISDSLMLVSPQLKVVWGNKEAAKVLNTEPLMLVGWNYLDLCPSHGDDCPVLRCLKSGVREETQRSTADGRHWEIKAFPLTDTNGQVLSVIRMVSDVTEKLQLREEATRSAQLASIGELAAGVAHEINNPINGIINYAQVLADTLKEQEFATEILNEVIEEGGRIANIVGSLLSFARQGKDDKEPIAFSEIYAASLIMVESQFAKDGIVLDVDFPESLPLVQAHKQQIQQVVLNILSNARYALNARYPGRHENKRIEIRSSVTNEDCVQIRFKDYGTGIPEPLMRKVMDPFFSTKPSDKGTGLGLSISHGIIADHQGKLMIASEEGLYTEICVELPIGQEAQ